MDGDVAGKPRAEVVRGLQIIARPAAIADKGRRDQNDGAELSLFLLGKSVDEHCSAKRVADENRAIVERRELSVERCLPCAVAWLILFGICG